MSLASWPPSGAIAQLNGAERVLAKDGELRCWLRLRGASDEDWVPAVVRLVENRVVADLWEAADGWPASFQEGRNLTLHGVTVTDKHDFTLIGARVNRLVFGGSGYEARKLEVQTLVLGSHCDETTKWSCLCLQTARLHEWLARQDVTVDQGYSDEPFTFDEHSHRWRRSDPLLLQRGDAEVLFAPRWVAGPSDGPDFTIRTQTDLVVRPTTPLTIAEFERGYVLPLLSFMTAASGGPDGRMYERLSDRSRNEAATIIRSGIEPVEPRTWDAVHVGQRFLLRADDTADPIGLFGRWLDLWPEAHDAILTFADTFRDDVYTRSRVLSLAVSLEAYWRTRFLQPGEDEHATKLIDKYKRVHKHTGVKAKVLAVNDRQLQGLVAARHLYAHLKQRNPKFDEAEIREAMVDNARRAATLFQAALLRDLGFEPKAIARLIGRYTKDWPLS